MVLKRALPPTHPGEILREDVLPALNLSVMEAAAIAHVDAMLDRSGFRVLVTPLFPPGLDKAVRDTLVAQRDRFERMMETVIADLPLPNSIDRRIFQRHYLGAINWIPVWYDYDGPVAPTDIVRQFIATLRR